MAKVKKEKVNDKTPMEPGVLDPASAAPVALTPSDIAAPAPAPMLDPAVTAINPKAARTLVGSGQIGMWDIHQEFGRGHDLNAYRGVPWWTDAGAAGHFSSGQISMYEFYGKRASAPSSPGIVEFTGLANILIPGSGAGIALDCGAPSEDRYIVVCASQLTAGASSTTNPLNSCTVGGYNLPLVVQNMTGNSVTNEQLRSAIFMGRVPAIQVGTVQIYNLNGANQAATASTFRLRGRAMAGTGQKASTAACYFNMPAASVVVGVSVSTSGGQAINWTAMTRHHDVDRGTWRFSCAYAWSPGGGGISVQRDQGTACFANIYAP